MIYERVAHREHGSDAWSDWRQAASSESASTKPVGFATIPAMPPNRRAASRRPDQALDRTLEDGLEDQCATGYTSVPYSAPGPGSDRPADPLRPSPSPSATTAPASPPRSTAPHEGWRWKRFLTPFSLFLPVEKVPDTFFSPRAWERQERRLSGDHVLQRPRGAGVPDHAAREGEKVDLTQGERNAIKRELAGLVEDYRRGAMRHVRRW
jgi:hypothetical protein